VKMSIISVRTEYLRATGLFFGNNARNFSLVDFDFRVSDRFVYEYDYTDA
jgi:hypothetical protein